MNHTGIFRVCIKCIYFRLPFLKVIEINRQTDYLDAGFSPLASAAVA